MDDPKLITDATLLLNLLDPKICHLAHYYIQFAVQLWPLDGCHHYSIYVLKQ